MGAMRSMGNGANGATGANEANGRWVKPATNWY